MPILRSPRLRGRPAFAHAPLWRVRAHDPDGSQPATTRPRRAVLRALAAEGRGERRRDDHRDDGGHMSLGSSYSARFEDALDNITRLQGTLTFLDSTAQPVSSQTTTRSFAFTFQTAGLAAGVAVYTPAIGDVIYDVGIAVTTAFDGTTPKLDIGSFSG